MTARKASPRTSVSNGSAYRHASWVSPWCLFVSGCCIGHFHGRYSLGGGEFCDRACWGGPTTSGTRHSDHSTAECLNDENGWHSIHVFYGTAEDPAVSSLPQPQLGPSQPGISSPDHQQPRKWYAQARQDELVSALLHNKTNGYFIDLAANDATVLSNTYALEKYYNWTGVCIEPNPIYWHNLTSYRKCMTIAAVVGKERMEGTMEIVVFVCACLAWRVRVAHAYSTSQ